MERTNSHSYNGNSKPQREYKMENLSDNERKVLQRVSEQTKIPFDILKNKSIAEIEQMAGWYFSMKEEETIAKTKMRIGDFYMQHFPWFTFEDKVRLEANVLMLIRKYKIRV